MSQPPRLIQFLVFPAVNMLDLSGPLRVFATANELLAFAGQAAAYDVTVIAAQAPLLSCEGLEFNPLPLPDVQSPCDTLLVIGGQGVGAACRDGALPRWIGQRAPVARRLVSICNGAFLLAAAGLLDGRRAVTHWSRCEALARRFPWSGRARFDLRQRRADLDFSRGHGRHRPGPGPGGRGPGS